MFESKSYSVRQKLISIGKKYTLFEDGKEILKCKKKKLKLKEDFRFETTDGEPVLKVTTDQIMDIAATYSVVDERSDKPVGAVKEDFTLFRHRWQILDDDGNNFATVREDNVPMALARRFITTLIPFSYVIDIEGSIAGEIKGQFSLTDEYNISINDKDKLDPRLVVAATVLIDAMESN